MTFFLHPQLQQDCKIIGKTSLCEVLLFNDNQFPWLVLVPMIPNISEVYDLLKKDQTQLSNSTNQIGQRMMEIYKGDKLNIATLGNMVPQLHIHIVVRSKNDIAWPKPVWGNFQPSPYSSTELAAEVSKIKAGLGSILQS